MGNLACPNPWNSLYKVCNGIKLLKRDDNFEVFFDHFCIVCHFWGSLGSCENDLDSKTHTNLECPNPWNALQEQRHNKTQKCRYSDKHILKFVCTEKGK